MVPFVLPLNVVLEVGISCLSLTCVCGLLASLANSWFYEIWLKKKKIEQLTLHFVS